MAKAQSTPTKAASAPSLKPSALAQDVTSPSLDALVLEQEQLGSDSSRSWKETVAGEEGTTRRTLSTFASAFTIATLVRSLCFSRLIFGQFLLKNLGPVEGEGVRWGWILAARAWDVGMGIWVWNRVEGGLTRDGVLFGALFAALSRTSLCAFEHAYFLLSTETVATVFATDIVSLAAAFTLLPTLLPHSLPTRPSVTAFQRIEENRELIVNIILAYTLATVVGAFTSFTIERLGGYKFVEKFVYEISVPSILSAETMTTSEMMKHPLVTIPSLRSYLAPGLPMTSHLGHSFMSAVLSIFFTTVLPTLNPLQLSITTLLVIAPSSILLLWDVLPISLAGALGVGSILTLRGALITGIVAWVLEELRSIRRIEHAEIILVDGENEIVGIVEAEVEIEDKVLEAGEGKMEGEEGLLVKGVRSRKGKNAKI